MPLLPIDRASRTNINAPPRPPHAGARVKFSNCAFSKTPVVNGEAIFENCTFATGKIENNGTATYTGSADSVAEMLTFEVQQQIQVRLTGKLQCFVVDGTSVMGLDHDGIALASAGGGASGGSSSSENNRLDVEVKEGEGEGAAWNDWAKNDGERQDKVGVSISPVRRACAYRGLAKRVPRRARSSTAAIRPEAWCCRCSST